MMIKKGVCFVCSENLTPNTLPQMNDEPPAVVRQIGKTTYRVRVHFNTASRETMGDKIKRMLRNEVRML